MPVIFFGALLSFASDGFPNPAWNEAYFVSCQYNTVAPAKYEIGMQILVSHHSQAFRQRGCCSEWLLGLQSDCTKLTQR